MDKDLFIEILFVLLISFCVGSFYYTVKKEQRDERESYQRLESVLRERLLLRFLN